MVKLSELRGAIESLDRVRELIEAALGRRKASLVIRNANLVDVFLGDVVEGVTIVVYGEWIVHVVRGDDDRYIGDSTHIIDAGGMYVAPGFIDAHMHIESTFLTPPELCRAIVPRGTTTIVADPHEIANVRGVEGVLELVEASRGIPLRILFTAPSCVPPRGCVGGARLSTSDVAELLGRDEFVGLGEVMDFDSVIEGDRELLERILLAQRVSKVVDGHAPGLFGDLLSAYRVAGVESCHESTSLAEALCKARKGLWIMAREGSAWRDLDEVLQIVTRYGLRPRRLMLVSDDVSALDIARRGHVDHLLRRAVELGMDPIEAIRSVTLVPAEYLGLRRLGGIAPGMVADIVVLTSLRDFTVDTVVFEGRVVARGGRLLEPVKRASFSRETLNSVRVADVGALDLVLAPPIREGWVEALCIEIVLGKAVTRSSSTRLRVAEGRLVLPPDVLYVAVVDRYGRGDVGRGLVRGLGEFRGSIAMSVAHDTHNIVVVGRDPRDMYAALRSVVDARGGIAVAYGGRALAVIELPVAGLMSLDPFETVVEKLRRLSDTCRELGLDFDHGFMSISLLTLTAIPELRITERGLFDVYASKYVDPFIAIESAPPIDCPKRG